MSNETDHVMRCPRCFGRDVRRSLHRGFIDNIMKMIHRSPYRCRGCHNRFYVFIARERAAKEPEDVESQEPELQEPVVQEPVQESRTEAHNEDVR